MSVNFRNRPVNAHDFAMIPRAEIPRSSFKIEKLICTKPVSECCGGCYKYKECPNCDGEGEIEVEID